MIMVKQWSASGCSVTAYGYRTKLLFKTRKLYWPPNPPICAIPHILLEVNARFSSTDKG